MSLHYNDRCVGACGLITITAWRLSGYHDCTRLIPGLTPSGKYSLRQEVALSGANSGVFNRHNPYMVPTCLNIGTRLVQENISGCVTYLLCVTCTGEGTCMCDVIVCNLVM